MPEPRHPPGLLATASQELVRSLRIGGLFTLKALLLALLEPIDQLRELESVGDFTARLAVLEEAKSMPFGAVWDMYCLQQGVPTGMNWLNEVRNYEDKVLCLRG